MNLLLRKNTDEILNQLKDIGYTPCPCCKFDGWDWLHISEYGVHGYMPLWEYDEDSNDYFDCGINVKLFLELAKEKISVFTNKS